MRRKFVFLLLSVQIGLPSSFTFGQSNLQQLLLNASSAFTGTQTISSATLTGQAEYHAGSTNETGSVILIARADGFTSMELQLGSGNRTETQDTFANGQGCSWSAEDGVVHTAPAHNCQVPLAWFLPEVGFFSAQLPASGTSTLLPGSISTIHWAKLTPTNASVDVVSLLAHIGKFDLEFSPASFLPSRLTYSVHPDSNAGIDIPVSVEFSNYQTINGVAIPFHIQRYFNGVLSLDIILANAVIAH